MIGAGNLDQPHVGDALEDVLRHGDGQDRRVLAAHHQGRRGDALRAAARRRRADARRWSRGRTGRGSAPRAPRSPRGPGGRAAPGPRWSRPAGAGSSPGRQSNVSCRRGPRCPRRCMALRRSGGSDGRLSMMVSAEIRSGCQAEKAMALCPPMECPARAIRSQPERLHHPQEVRGEVLGGVLARRRPLALAVAALVEGQHVVAPDEGGDHRVEPVGVGRAAVQEAERGASRRRPLERAQAEPVHREGSAYRRDTAEGRRGSGHERHSIPPGRVTFLSRLRRLLSAGHHRSPMRVSSTGRDIAGLFALASLARMLLFEDAREDYL